jgi:parvulin-like peptidyl-prolyl isomerase
VSYVKKFLAVLLLFLSLGIFAQAQQETPQIVAKVNGEEISKSQLDRLTNITGVILTLYRQYPRFAQMLLTTDEGKAFLRAYEREILESLISWRLIIQEARKRGLTVSEETLQAELEKTIQGILEKNDLTEDELAEILLTQRGQTLEEFRAQIQSDLEERLLYDLLKEAVTAEVSVSEEEIKAYYEQNLDSFKDEEGNTLPLDEVAGKILVAVTQEKRDTLWKDFLKKLREEAEVEIYI